MFKYKSFSIVLVNVHLMQYTTMSVTAALYISEVNFHKKYQFKNF